MLVYALIEKNNMNIYIRENKYSYMKSQYGDYRKIPERLLGMPYEIFEKKYDKLTSDGILFFENRKLNLRIFTYKYNADLYNATDVEMLRQLFEVMRHAFIRKKK